MICFRGETLFLRYFLIFRVSTVDGSASSRNKILRELPADITLRAGISQLHKINSKIVTMHLDFHAKEVALLYLTITLVKALGTIPI